MAASGFPKQHRLLNAADYKAVFQKSQFKVSCRYFLVLAIENGLPQSRLGIVVAKKNVAKAVQRNRIKRQIRECFRHTGLAGLDLVVLARKDADTLANHQLAQSLSRLMSDLAAKLARVQTPASVTHS